MACGMIWAFVPAAAIRIMMRMMEAVTSGVLMSRRWSTVTVITPIGAPRNMPAATFGVRSSPMQIAMLNSVQSMQVPSANGELPSPLRPRAVFFDQAVQYIRQLQAWSAGRKAYKHRASRGRDACGDAAGVAAHCHLHLP